MNALVTHSTNIYTNKGRKKVFVPNKATIGTRRICQLLIQFMGNCALIASPSTYDGEITRETAKRLKSGT